MKKQMFFDYGLSVEEVARQLQGACVLRQRRDAWTSELSSWAFQRSGNRAGLESGMAYSMPVDVV